MQICDKTRLTPSCTGWINPVSLLQSRICRWLRLIYKDRLAPLEQKGADALRRSWGIAVGSFEGPIEYEIDHLDISVSGDLALSRSLAHFGGTTKEGTRVLNQLRSTLGFRKIAGEWKLIHQHVSVPFDMSTGKALLNLEA